MYVAAIGSVGNNLILNTVTYVQMLQPLHARIGSMEGSVRVGSQCNNVISYHSGQEHVALQGTDAHAPQRRPTNNFLIFFYFDVCTVHLVQFIIQTNKCTTHTHTNTHTHTYIYKQYFIYRKYCYMFRCICIIFRKSYPSTLLML